MILLVAVTTAATWPGAPATYGRRGCHSQSMVQRAESTKNHIKSQNWISRNNPVIKYDMHDTQKCSKQRVHGGSWQCHGPAD